MKALVKQKSGMGLWMEDVAIPEIGPNDVLIKIKKTAICGTDLHIFNWDEWASNTIAIPTVIGHEFCGVIEKVGEAVKGFSPGDRVSGEGHLNCGYCRNCRAGRRHLCRNAVGIGVHRDGCFAEYLSLPAQNAFKIPDTVPDEIASFFDPFGNAVHSALSFDLVGEDVLITGAGPVGLLAVPVARKVGARHIVITDINEYRLEMALRLGATRVVNPTRENLSDVMNELKMTEGFDVGLEMSGSPQAFESMLKVMNHGGRIASLGIFPEAVKVDWSQVIFKGLIIKGIYGREMYETWYKMKSLLETGLDISGVISHQLPVEEFQKGFEIMRSGQCGKVVLEW